MIVRTRPIQKLRTIVKLFLTLLKHSHHHSVATLALLKSGPSRNRLEQIAVNKLMLKHKYFQDLEKQIGEKRFAELCSDTFMSLVPATNLLIRQGEIGERLYLLLEGKVSVHIHSPKTREGRWQILQQQIALSEKKENIVPDYENTDLFDALEVAVLGPGAVLGEMSILDSTITSASVRAMTQCRFACINKENFLNYVSRDKWHEIETKLKVLSNLPFLANWSQGDLKSFSYHFKPQKLIRSQYLYRQGDTVKGLYLISDGTLQLTKHHQQYTQRHSLMKQRLNVRDTIISVLTSPQSLYEQSLLHHYSAQCTSIEAEVLFVSKEDLEKRLNWHRHSQDMIESFATQRQVWRSMRSREATKTSDDNLLDYLVVPQQTRQHGRKGIVSSLNRTPSRLNLITASMDLENSFREQESKPRPATRQQPQIQFTVFSSFRERQRQKRIVETHFNRSLEILLGTKPSSPQNNGPYNFRIPMRPVKSTKSELATSKPQVMTPLSSQGHRRTTAQTMRSSFLSHCRTSSNLKPNAPP